MARRLREIDATILNVNQLVEIYTSRTLRGPHYRSRIEEIAPTHLTIAMPFDKGFPVFMAPGATIYGKIITDSAPYLFSSHFIEKQMTPVPIWMIAVPNELVKIQQREFVRIDAKLHVTATMIEQEEESTPIKLLVNDISGGGIRLVCPHPYPIGTNLLLAFELPDEEYIETIGQVVRVEQPQPDRTLFWIGIKYIGMKERERNKIIKYVFQKQLERHRRGF